MNIRFQIYTSGPSAPTAHFDGAYFTVKCVPGYFWDDGTQSKTLNCYSGRWYSRLWNPFPQSCTGMMRMQTILFEPTEWVLQET